MNNLTLFLAGEKQRPLEKDAGEKTIAWLDKIRNSNGSLPTSKIRLNMQRVMQNNAAVFRTQETLEEGNLFHLVIQYRPFSWFQKTIMSKGIYRAISLAGNVLKILRRICQPQI